VFQFHNGSIKGSIFAKMEKELIGFNSTMVRLKAKIGTFSAHISGSFNSTMVRLKGSVPDNVPINR